MSTVVDTGPAETFDADTVHKLRAEAAEHRVKAKRAVEEANARVLKAVIAQDGRLVDPDVLPLEASMLDEDGWLDAAKVSDAIAEKIAEKPYLLAQRPTTVIAQGVREPAPTPPSFGELIRARL